MGWINPSQARRLSREFKILCVIETSWWMQESARLKPDWLFKIKLLSIR